MHGSHTVAWVQTLIAAAAGLFGVFIGGVISIYIQNKDRRHRRIREQLEGFYSPMLGMRGEIRVKSEVRVKIQSAAGEVWQELVGRCGGDPEATRALDESRWPEFEKLIQYDNNQLVRELIPIYQKMAAHFLSHMWLAEPSTMAFYAELVEYVEVWNRFLQGALPQEVIGKIGHTEGKLKAFYEDLEAQMKKLQAELKK